MNRKWYIIGGGVAVLLIVLVIGKKQGWIGKNKNGHSVKVETVGTKTIVETVTASGKIQPEKEVKISSEVSGEIIALPIKEGQKVEVGDLLVKINPDLYESAVTRAIAAVNTAKAGLASAQAQFIEAEKNYNRNQKLHKDEVISQAEYDASLRAYKVAELNEESAVHQLKSAEANLDEARKNLKRTTILSPGEGTISMLNVELGERVVGTAQMTGTEMLRVANLNEMEVRVDVNENDIIRINKGDTAIIDVDSYALLDKKFKGIVTQIANTAQPKTSPDAVTEFEVRIRILDQSFVELQKEGYKNPFKPGMTASVDIITTTKADIQTVPLAAVTTRTRAEMNELAEKADGDESGDISTRSASSEENEEMVEVIFVNSGGVAKLHEVETGISDYENIEIITTLHDTTEVVTGPFIAVSKTLKDGDNIVGKGGKDEKDDDSDDE